MRSTALLKSVGKLGTVVSGEYEGNVDTTLAPPRVQYTVQHRARQRKETSLDMGHFSLSSREPTPI